MSKKRVLLIGLDAAEWGVINQLTAAGVLPNMQRLISGGTSGSIRTLNPPFSPMLWTSVATGKTADKHGILGFIEPTADNTIRPISSTSRKTRALWNIFTQQGFTSNVIGWWPSHPCEPIKGIMVSNQFQKIAGKKTDPWPLMPNATSGLNEFERKEIGSCRMHPNDVSVNDMRIFVPNLENVDQEKDHRLKEIQVEVAEALSIKNAALYAMSKNDWDFTAVYFNELDRLSHRFMMFHPPQLPGIPDEAYALYKNVMVATYTFYDAIIGQLLHAADENTFVIVCSDHGFYSDSRRITKVPEFTAGIALEHNPNGIFIVHGPGIKQGQSIYDSTLLDIAPTILSMMNVAVGKDMDGKVLEALFTSPSQTNQIESWDLEDGDFGEHDKNVLRDPFSDREALNQLIELGYVERPDASTEEQLAKCLNETNYNLSIVLAEKGETQRAIDIVIKLYEEDLVDVRYNLDLIKYYERLSDFEAARKILSNFKKFDISGAVNFDFIEGRLLFAENKKKEALIAFRKAQQKSPNYKELLVNLGLLYNKLKQYDNSIEVLQRLIQLESTHPTAYHLLTIAYCRSRRFDEAVDSALELIKLQRNFAPGYFYLGEAFYQLEQFEPAAQALELCLKISPGISRARNLLLNIYAYEIPNEELYKMHLSVFQTTRKGEIVVVSGLPRSGTSMMMQMLKAGGMEVLSDDSVQADESNPLGYFEFEPVKNSRVDNSWMENADGKAVKVIAQLLPKLKMNYNLKVVFMERNINEVIISQNRMIATKSGNKKKEETFDMRLANTFVRQIEEVKDWMDQKMNIEVLYVQYKNVVENPLHEVRVINEFLDWRLDEQKMAKVVTPELYRIKS